MCIGDHDNTKKGVEEKKGQPRDFELCLKDVRGGYRKYRKRGYSIFPKLLKCMGV